MDSEAIQKQTKELKELMKELDEMKARFNALQKQIENPAFREDLEKSAKDYIDSYIKELRDKNSGNYYSEQAELKNKVRQAVQEEQ